MKAALYQGIKNIEIAEKPDYICGDDGIVLQNIYSSICGTDVAVYNHGTGLGHRIIVGGEFGHETVCRVSAVGKNVKNVEIGERVYPYPRLVTGDTKRAGTIGGFSEYIYCPCPKWGESIYHVDGRISDREAALIEPFTVGCRAARRGYPQTGEKAIVFGAGTIGIAAAIALKYFGCGRVVICDHSDFRLGICQELGFEIYNNKSDNNLNGLMKICGKSSGIHGSALDSDIWIDAAGSDSVLSAYEKLGKVNSRMVLVAVGTNKREVDILGLTFGQKSITGSGGYFPEDVRDVMEMMKSGRWEIEKIITQEYKLDDLSSAIEKATDTDSALNGDYLVSAMKSLQKLLRRKCLKIFYIVLCVTALLSVCNLIAAIIPEPYCYGLYVLAGIWLIVSVVVAAMWVSRIVNKHIMMPIRKIKIVTHILDDYHLLSFLTVFPGNLAYAVSNGYIGAVTPSAWYIIKYFKTYNINTLREVPRARSGMSNMDISRILENPLYVRADKEVYAYFFGKGV